MFIDPSTVASLAMTAFENRQKVMPLFRRIKYFIQHGHLQVSVFGAGGTGKSFLGKFLSGKLKPSDAMAFYNDSIGIEKYGFSNDIVGSVVVPPGQVRRSTAHWPDLYRDLAQGKSRGVINVVSWGYHSFTQLGYQETKYYKAGMTQSDFLDAYLKACRDRELELMDNLAHSLVNAKKKLWMITLVNKQDLWWAERDKVRQHYMEGAYNSYIEQITHARGQQFFIHEYLSASLLMSNFSTIKGELLSTTTGGYDQNLHYAHLQKLLETIDSFANM